MTPRRRPSSGAKRTDKAHRLGARTDAFRLWLGYGALSAGLEITRLVAETLFVTTIGISHLPTIFAIQALLRVVGSWAYVHRAQRLGARALLLWALSWMAAAVVLPSMWAGLTGAWWPYAVVYATIEAADTVIKVHWGVYLLELYRPREAKTLFPILYTAASVGRSAGGALVRQTAATALLAWLPAAALSVLLPIGGIFVLAARRKRPEPSATKKTAAPPVWLQEGKLDRILRKPLPQGASDLNGAPRRPSWQPPATAAPEEADLGRASPWSSMGHALGLLKTSKLVRAIALATVLLVVTRFLVRYVSLAILRADLDTDGLARLLGTYSALAHLVGLGIQILLTPRLTARFGITATNSLFSALLWLATLALATWGRATTALVARFAESEAKTAIKTPISPIFYYPIAANTRPAARALILGVVSPTSAVFTALLLELLQVRLSIQWLAALAAAAAGALVIATIHQNREYARSLSRPTAL